MPRAMSTLLATRLARRAIHSQMPMSFAFVTPVPAILAEKITAYS
jgi:hypothetical protein